MLIGVELGADYKLAQPTASSEEQTQKLREGSVFQLVYIKQIQIPQNPVKELDEFYAKDEKVLQVDLEEIVLEQAKQKEEEKFLAELTAIQSQLHHLDEGK
jgi:hypothetical protein